MLKTKPRQKNIHENYSDFARSQNQAHTWKTFSYQVLTYVRAYHAAENTQTRKKMLTAKHLMYCRGRVIRKLYIPQAVTDLLGFFAVKYRYYDDHR